MSRWVTRKSRPLIWILTNIVAQPQIGKLIFESFWLVLPFVEFGFIHYVSTNLLGSLTSPGWVSLPMNQDSRIWSDLFQSYICYFQVVSAWFNSCRDWDIEVMRSRNWLEASKGTSTLVVLQSMCDRETQFFNSFSIHASRRHKNISKFLKKTFIHEVFRVTGSFK